MWFALSSVFMICTVFCSFMTKCKAILLDNINILPYVREIARNAEEFTSHCKLITEENFNDLLAGKVGLNCVVQPSH